MYGRLATIQSKRSLARRKKIRFVKGDPSITECCAAFSRARLSASREMSVAGTAARGSCRANVIAMTPEPVPTSRTLHPGVSVASRVFKDQLDELLGFGTGDKGPAVAKKGSSKKFSRAEQMLKRFAGAAIANQIAERSPLGIGKRTIKFEIKIQTFLAKDMCEQMLCVEPRTFHSVILEIAGRRG